MSVQEKRGTERVVFSLGIHVRLMAIDGTWRLDCLMEDVSETGAKLKMASSIGGLNLKEFFLVLSSTGLAFRRCELVWVDGDHIGVNFLEKRRAKMKTALA